MMTSQAGYRLVQMEIDGSVEVSAPMPRDEALAAFDERLHARGFGPTNRRRLMVVSCDDSVAQTRSRTRRRRFRLTLRAGAARTMDSVSTGRNETNTTWAS